MNYAICIRRNPGYCVITYSNEILGEEFEFGLINFDEGTFMKLLKLIIKCKIYSISLYVT